MRTIVTATCKHYAVLAIRRQPPKSGMAASNEGGRMSGMVSPIGSASGMTALADAPIPAFPRRSLRAAATPLNRRPAAPIVPSATTCGAAVPMHRAGLPAAVAAGPTGSLLPAAWGNAAAWWI